MNPVQTAAVNNAMKIVYAQPLYRDIVMESELMSMFQEDMNVQHDESTGGQYITTAHYVRLAGAAGARVENDYIPESQDPVFQNARIYLKKIMGTIEATGDVFDRVTGDEGSFLNFMQQALPGVKERVTNELDRMYIGWGRGIKARINGVPVQGNGYIVVDSALGVAGYEDAWLQFTEGEKIVFSASDTGSPLKDPGTTQSALITSIDEVNNRLYITAATSLWNAIANDDYIFGGDGAGTSAPAGGTTDKELSGLLAGVDDGSIVSTYHNIDRTAAGNRFWVGRVKDASGAPYNGEVTEQLFITQDAKVRTISGKKITHVVMSVHGPIGYWMDMKTDRSLNDPRRYTGGVEYPLQVVLGDRTVPLRTARKLPPQVAFMLHAPSWRRWTNGTWRWDDRTGSIWKPVSDGTGRKDSVYAFGKMYEALGCFMPRANLRIEGLNRQFDY